ncbi:hypothetical protein KA005_72945 [bacterium]|nr:hypothetical protein [bacterium]
MAKVMLEASGVSILEGVDTEEDLKRRAGIECSMNPPPEDRRCDCCGRRVSELKPFGKAGNWLLNELDGALLAKRVRVWAIPDEELDEIWAKYTWSCRTEDDYREAKQQMIQELGEEKADQVDAYAEASQSTYASWECRDCFGLDSREYHEKIHERYLKDK